MAHRIRYALKETSFAEKLSGIIEADEAMIGGIYPQSKGTNKTNKVPVVSLVQRGGPVRSQVMPTVNGKNLKQAIRDNVMICSEIHTTRIHNILDLNPNIRTKP